jgi:hypothetical protein
VRYQLVDDCGREVAAGSSKESIEAAARLLFGPDETISERFVPGYAMSLTTFCRASTHPYAKRTG